MSKIKVVQIIFDSADNIFLLDTLGRVWHHQQYSIEPTVEGGFPTRGYRMVQMDLPDEPNK